MMAGGGPFALETGMVKPQGDVSRVRIYHVNIDAKVEAVVQTPGGVVSYDGDTAIDGVPGTSAPVQMNFMDVAGSTCGKLLPTGNAIDIIEGIPVTCMDAAMRSEEHTSELQSLMRISYAVFCLKKKTQKTH